MPTILTYVPSEEIARLDFARTLERIVLHQQILASIPHVSMAIARSSMFAHHTDQQTVETTFATHVTTPLAQLDNVNTMSSNASFKVCNHVKWQFATTKPDNVSPSKTLPGPQQTVLLQPMFAKSSTFLLPKQELAVITYQNAHNSLASTICVTHLLVLLVLAFTTTQHAQPPIRSEISVMLPRDAKSPLVCAHILAKFADPMLLMALATLEFATTTLVPATTLSTHSFAAFATRLT
jgi:hypothetical protein